MARRFVVDGARKDTGAEQQLVIEANDAAWAEHIASLRGLLVSSVHEQPEQVPAVQYVLGGMSRSNDLYTAAVWARGAAFLLEILSVIGLLSALVGWYVYAQIELPADERQAGVSVIWAGIWASVICFPVSALLHLASQIGLAIRDIRARINDALRDHQK